MASTMQLEFSQAMSDFKTMFPEMDDDVIEAVLRANQGAVDATIDQLLTMSTDNQNEKLRNEIEQVESGSTPCKKAEVKSAVGMDNELIVSVKPPDGEASLPVKRKWEPKLLGPLPPHFLRIPVEQDSLILTDYENARIARFLQNEEFMAQIRWNEEFLAALDNEQGLNGTKAKGHEDDAAFKERLKNMGKISRKKFAQLTRMLTWQGSKKQSTPSRHGPAPNSLLLQEEHSDDDEKPNSSLQSK